MVAVMEASPIDAGFRRIKALIQQGRAKVRVLSVGGHQPVALRLADRLTGIEAFAIGDIEDMPLSRAMTLLGDIEHQIQVAIDEAEPEPPQPSVTESVPVREPAPESEPLEEEWLSLPVAAQRIGMSHANIWLWVKEGKVASLSAPNCAKKKLVKWSDVQAMHSSKRKRRATPRAINVAQAPTTPPTPVQVTPMVPTVATVREKTQRHELVFVEATWWHDPKAPQNPPPAADGQHNTWQEVA